MFDLDKNGSISLNEVKVDDNSYSFSELVKKEKWIVGIHK